MVFIRALECWCLEVLQVLVDLSADVLKTVLVDTEVVSTILTRIPVCL